MCQFSAENHYLVIKRMNVNVNQTDLNKIIAVRLSFNHVP